MQMKPKKVQKVFEQKNNKSSCGIFWAIKFTFVVNLTLNPTETKTMTNV